MKNNKTSLVLNLVFILTFFLGANGQVNNSIVAPQIERNDTFYYYEGRQVFLKPIPQKYYIRVGSSNEFSCNISGILRNEGLPNFSLIELGVARDSKEILVHFNTLGNVKNLQTSMERIRNNYKCIEYVSTAYLGYHNSKNYMIPIEPVYVEFKKNVSYAEMIALGNSVGLEMIGQDPDDLDGEVYEFRLSGMYKNILTAANRLYETGKVIFSEPDMIEFGKIKSNPLLPMQWGISNTGQSLCDLDPGTAGADAKVDEAWNITKGAGIRIAILDDGVQMDHPDLDVVAGKDFKDNGSGGPVGDLDDHGTACAGVAAALDNTIGVVGVAPEAKIITGRIIGSTSGVSGIDIIKTSHVKKAFKWAWKDQNAAVISCSWNKSFKAWRIKKAIKKAKKKGRNGKGTVVLFAAGNNGNSNEIDWPAKLDHVIAVGASDMNDDVASFSNAGSEIDVVAPGVALYTTDRTGGYGYNRGPSLDAYPGDDANTDYFECYHGTSAATPFAAGVCALIIARNGNLTADEVQGVLEDTADDIVSAGFDNSSGHGRVNAFKAVENICLGSGSEIGSYHRSTKRYKAYKFVNGEMFVATGKVLLKINNTGGSGQNMFAIQRSGSIVNSVPGYSYWKGTQVFNSDIRDVDYILGYTIVSLADGRIVKINGTGGSGQNMFAISEHANGFTGISGYSYYVGSHKFQSGIRDVTHTGGKTLLSFDNKKMLKINGSGGSGFNLFAITENSNHFYGISGYGYYVGEQKFGSKVSTVKAIGGITFVCFEDGRIMKINGSGGSGQRMFNVEQTGYGFQTYDASYTAYLLGSQKLSSEVTDIAHINSKTFLAFKNKKLMKVNGTGGTGQNMFNITETSGGFQTYSTSYNVYLSGHQRFNSRVTDIDYIDGNTLVSFYNGKILKVSGNGGTGARMFNVEETSGGFQTYSTSYTAYLIGSSNFNASVASVTSINGATFIALANGKWIKINGSGGSGYNMFALVDQGSYYTTRCGYYYFIGCQDFTNNFYKRNDSESIVEEGEASAYIEDVTIFPNPTRNQINISVKEVIDGSSSSNYLEILDIKGALLEKMYLKNRETTIDLSSYKKGLYIIKITYKGAIEIRKIVKN